MPVCDPLQISSNAANIKTNKHKITNCQFTMTSPLDQFISGMIRDMSQEFGISFHLVLVVDNPVPNADSYRDSDDSVASGRSESLDSSEHMRILRWSASMGDKRSLARMKAAEEPRMEWSCSECMIKLRWSASMGDAASITMLKKEKRWSEKNDQSTQSLKGSAKPLRVPRRRHSSCQGKCLSHSQ
jgi:hypothetical protein